MNWDLKTATNGHGGFPMDNLTLQRIRAEFLEMPGLCVTCQQARRLWGLDEDRCRQLLDGPVDARFFCRTGDGMYTRMTEGRASRVLTRKVRAGF